ncbi:polysaccharide biosynthesis protein [Caulobacter sp. KR2-114]|uniref:polysaccharide biosynthesis protein n=1 Tax=Caulobacter sp. KR2-114 TaxID=3400912 RepID=UPI003BFEC418
MTIVGTAQGQFTLASSVVFAALLYAAVAVGFDLVFRADRSAWRFTSLADVLAILRNSTLTALTLLLLLFIGSRAIYLPRSTLVMAWMLDIGFITGARLIRRAAHERSLGALLPPRASAASIPADRESLLIIGDVDQAEAFLRGQARNPEAAFSPVGIVALAAGDAGREVRGAPVLGDLSGLGGILDTVLSGPRHLDAVLFLCDPARTAGVEPEHLGRLKAARTHLLRPSRITELRDGEDREAGGSALVSISVEELLARPTVRLDDSEIRKLVAGQRVLVTGAGGSIGSEICRQVAALGCAHLSLLDVSEFGLFNIHREMGDSHPRLSRRDILCDIRNAERLRAWVVSEKPDIVFHAAALKHVTLVENHPCEGVLTNIVGTWNVAEAARAAGARRMVFISTDKAVEPSCVMGATKRLAETVVQTHRERASRTRFSVVRFGNVLGSAGSVVPIFKSQIERGGPVTVTHPDVERFFMTIPEAVQLVLHAVAKCEAAPEGRSPEGRSGVYVLDMGKPVKILDLAQRMIELHGKVPGRDIPITFTGLKPGEKLTEILVDQSETAQPCGPGVIEVTQARPTPGLTWTQLLSLEAIARRGDPDDVRASIFELLERAREPIAGGVRRSWEEERAAAAFAAQ